MKTTTVTIKTTQQKEVEKEVTIGLPYFTRTVDNQKYYKVFGTGDHDCIKLFDNKGNFTNHYISICNDNKVADALNESLIECTEQEWTEQFERAILYFQTINRADDL